MCHFSRNECMLETISVADHYVEGGQLNWCMFLLNESFEVWKTFISGAQNSYMAIWWWL